MEICHHIQLQNRFQPSGVTDLGSSCRKPPPILAAEPPRPLQLGQNLQVGHQLPRLSLAGPVGLQLPPLTAQVEDKPLVGKHRQLLLQAVDPPVHTVRLRQEAVPVKHLLQKEEKVPVQTLHSGADFPAVVVGEDQHIHEHPHPQADSGVPNAAQGVGDGSRLRVRTEHHQNEAGQGRRGGDMEHIIEGYQGNHPDAHGGQMADRQHQQHNSRQRAINNAGNLRNGRLQGVPKGGLNG